MGEEIKKFNYTTGIYDVICRAIREKVKAESKKQEIYGIGVYTDRYCEQELMTCPMKKIEERMQIAKCFNGVDFVFEVDTKDPKQVEEIAQKAYLEYIEEQKKEEEKKEYKVGFVIGSFDVFHAGHLENLMLAKEMCEKLVVVLKTDERIHVRKNKHPRQSTAERTKVLSFMKIVDNVIHMDLDATREDILEDIMELYEGIEKKDIVAIFGSDLKEKEAIHIANAWEGISVVFTDRDPNKMKVVSSTNYQKICDAKGGIGKLEELEEESLR